jgi:hypothetical protein
MPHRKNFLQNFLDTQPLVREKIHRSTPLTTGQIKPSVNSNRDLFPLANRCRRGIHGARQDFLVTAMEYFRADTREELVQNHAFAAIRPKRVVIHANNHVGPNQGTSGCQFKGVVNRARQEIVHVKIK